MGVGGIDLKEIVDELCKWQTHAIRGMVSGAAPARGPGSSNLGGRGRLGQEVPPAGTGPRAPRGDTEDGVEEGGEDSPSWGPSGH